MPYIDPAMIAEAKQMDLLTYLQNYEPQELVHISGNVYCTKTHDSLKISNGKWCWHSRGIGGRSALDYLIKVRAWALLMRWNKLWDGRRQRRPSIHLNRSKSQKSLFCRKAVIPLPTLLII